METGGPRDWSPFDLPDLPGTPVDASGDGRAGEPATIRGSLDGTWAGRNVRVLWLMVAVLLAGLAVAATSIDRLFPPRASVPIGDSAPPAGVDAGTSRLLPVPEPPSGDGGYTFALTQPGSDDPVRWDPCRPIHYVVRPGEAGEAGIELVRDAVAQISEASGLQFVDDGVTDEEPVDDRDVHQPDRYGDRWAPVLVAWSSPDEEPRLEGDTAGLGGGHPMADTTQRLTYVSGTVWLDTPALQPWRGSAGRRALLRATVVHELAHVLGAGHVDDPTQLMHAESTGQTRLGDGDRRGLAILGQGECRPAL